MHFGKCQTPLSGQQCGCQPWSRVSDTVLIVILVFLLLFFSLPWALMVSSIVGSQFERWWHWYFLSVSGQTPSVRVAGCFTDVYLHHAIRCSYTSCVCPSLCVCAFLPNAVETTTTTYFQSSFCRVSVCACLCACVHVWRSCFTNTWTTWEDQHFFAFWANDLCKFKKRIHWFWCDDLTLSLQIHTTHRISCLATDIHKTMRRFPQEEFTDGPCCGCQY